MEDKENKEDNKVEEAEKLEDLKCKNCRYWHFLAYCDDAKDDPKALEDVLNEVIGCKIRYYDPRKLSINQKIYHRKWVTVGPLEVCEYYQDKRKRKRPEEALYESIQMEKKILEKMADAIVGLQSIKSPKTKAAIEFYNKRIEVFKKHVIDYNKNIEEGIFRRKEK